ncbi:hypothetical protein [Psychromonas sp. 14N.309.X.WAT.B.A12]|uniref:hypothetical protein n=1 Tax=unclassified Psychromonas TaxID=2614957 RepID=UPI0025B27909|nr:hypothetical protein [Psychromonas sp. 14N.309.X.WAT.B.A12]MDN2662065.1 hypothetical protein [Psychromonas sp. 14N.309.X.WAT.B.A12]
MVTVETPTGFEWNDLNRNWVKHYLMPKSALLSPLINGNELDVDTMDEADFINFCHLLETSAEGRELRNKMFKAWRSKKSRDSDNGKKLYTFNMSLKAGDQLKKIAKNSPLNATLELLIFAESESHRSIQSLQQQLKQAKQENLQLKAQLNSASLQGSTEDDQADIQALLNTELQVTELAKLEKSKLIKQILLLKRQLEES